MKKQEEKDESEEALEIRELDHGRPDFVVMVFSCFGDPLVIVL